MNIIARKLNKYFAIGRTNVQSSLSHAITLFSRSFLVIMRVWILMYVYTAIYQGSHILAINELTLPMVIWSVTLTQSFQAASRPPISDLIAEEIRSGTIAYAISKPYSYVLFYLATYWGMILPRLVTNLIIGIVTAWLLVGTIPITLTTILLGSLLLFFGYMIEFVFFFFIGLCAFKIEDISPLLWNYNKAQIIFGGLVLPAALFPVHLRSIVEYIPFTQIFYGPSRLLVHFNYDLFWHYLSIQLFWLVILLPLLFFYFYKAIKNVSINGG